MPRSRSFVAAAVLVAAGPVAAAVAQPQPPVAPQRPAFSPYLSLLYPGASPGFNYFGFVQPQIQAQQNFAQLSTQLQQTNSSVQALNSGLLYGVDPNLPLTGHAAVFNNTGPYFSSNPIYGGRGMGGYGGGYNTYGGGGVGGRVGPPSAGGVSRPAQSSSGASFGR